MAAEEVRRASGVKMPVFDAPRESGKVDLQFTDVIGQQQLGRVDACHLFQLATGKLGVLKVAGADIDQGDSAALDAGANRGEVAALGRWQKRGLGDRSWAQHARDGPLDQPPTGFAHLLSDCQRVPGGKQPRQVMVEGVMRVPAIGLRPLRPKFLVVNVMRASRATILASSSNVS